MPRFSILKSNVPVRVFQVLIVLIQKDLWKVVVLHCGTSYFTVLVLLEALVVLVVFLRKTKDEFVKPWITLKKYTISRYSCQ